MSQGKDPPGSPDRPHIPEHATMTRISENPISSPLDGGNAALATHAANHPASSPVPHSNQAQSAINAQGSASISPGSEFDAPQGAILALDLGTLTGWAIRSPEGLITSGSLNLKGGRYEGGGMRFLRFRQRLTDMNAAAGGFGRIVFEEVRRHAGVDAAHVYGGMLATLTAWAEHHQIPYEGVPVGTWKKALTGKGNASKDAVGEAVRAQGYAPDSEDEADALAILLWALAQ